MSNQSFTDLPQIIVSDDFTGANDIGVGLVDSGSRVSVILNPSSRTALRSDTAYVLCSDSRDDEAAVAKGKLQQLIRLYPEMVQQQVLLKKVDSTLRGNIGAEIASFVDMHFPLAIVAIGAPEAGRRTTQGYCYVHDQLLTETEYASDPKSPVRSARIKVLLETQTALTVDELFIDEVRTASLAERLESLHRSGAQVIVCDAETASDLRAIYQAATQLSCHTLLVTTGEMAAAVKPRAASHQALCIPNAMPLLGVIGSMSQVTLEQVEALESHQNVTMLDVSVADVLSPEREKYQHSLVRDITASLKNHHHCLICTCQNAAQRHEIQEICDAFNLSRPELGNRLKQFLAQVVRSVMQPAHQHLPGSLLLCGGDIALAVCRELEGDQFELQGMIAGCLPCGTLSYGNRSSLAELTIPVFTKAGGFGDPTSFTQLIEFLEHYRFSEHMQLGEQVQFLQQEDKS
ncbi:four-carbon acid sugar kinase family protein [Vibrio mangrovi]|uniref:Four-carbon acid sugar kinase family protein n=1 Tax=Vibrio mangrovi TaxID=474394 RepID=A0A1Y6IX36_9VIBR|nr:four-carbon acid sugar kinase family protein [Vibrio mangrovi]MDW6004761.1 four-carbon acid sugar kinase family protein [Vibrio mangrovi]SMS01052.1 hypothetical protein VIM7927_02329 [Vibrio mangrovi]